MLLQTVPILYLPVFPEESVEARVKNMKKVSIERFFNVIYFEQIYSRLVRKFLRRVSPNFAVWNHFFKSNQGTRLFLLRNELYIALL